MRNLIHFGILSFSSLSFYSCTPHFFNLIFCLPSFCPPALTKHLFLIPNICHVHVPASSHARVCAPISSVVLNLRLSRFQMNWLQNCWVTKQTLVPWSLLSRGGANFTGLSDCVFPCPLLGGRARGTLGKATPPVCACFAPS